MRAFLSLLVLVAGCTPSNLGDQDKVTLNGLALGQDEQPLPAQRVVLVKHPSVGDLLGEGTLFVATLGLVCLADPPPALCGVRRDTLTNAAGKFSFVLTGKDTQDSLGNAADFSLALQRPARDAELKGPAAEQRFKIQQEKLQVPDLKLWEPALTLLQEAGSLHVSFARLPDSYGHAIQHGLLFETPGGFLVWGQDAPGETHVDARLLEDLQGAVAAVASSFNQGPGSAWSFRFRSKTQTVAGTAGPPPSRGKPCAIQGPTGPVALTPCPFTDGDFSSPFPTQPEDCSQGACETGAAANHWVWVDLGAPQTLTLVVGRNLVGTAQVETSLDGQTFEPVASAMAQSGTFKLDVLDGTVARYVRLRGVEAGTHLDGLTELSVW